MHEAMPVSKMDNDASCNVVSMVTTQNSIDNGVTFPSIVKSHGKNSIPFIIDASQNHINSIDERSVGRIEGQDNLGETVDQDRQNRICTSNLTKSKAPESSFLSPKTIKNQNHSQANENSCLSTYGLNSSMTLNDGKESIELMVNSLSSVGNHEEIQINNNNGIVSMSGKEHETDTSFSTNDEKVEKPSEHIPQSLELDTRHFVENPITKSTNEEASIRASEMKKWDNASKPDTDNFHNINEIELTPSRRASCNSNQSISSFNSNKGNITKPLLDDPESTCKKEVSKDKETNEYRKQSITPKIIISNKSINSCTHHAKQSKSPATTQNKLIAPGNPTIMKKSVTNVRRSLPINNTASGVTTTTINAAPLRNHQAPLIKKSPLLKSGILIFIFRL